MTDLKNLQEENLIMRNEKVYKLTLTALMAALSYVVFTFLQIKIALPGGDATSLHLGNAVVPDRNCR